MNISHFSSLQQTYFFLIKEGKHLYFYFVHCMYKQISNFHTFRQCPYDFTIIVFIDFARVFKAFMTLIWMADVLKPCKVLVTMLYLGRKSEDSLSTFLPTLIPGLRTSVSKKQPLLSFTHLLIAPKHFILRRVCSVRILW